MVIIDAGHGKNTAGKRSPVWSDGKQLLEWEFNRDIARRIYRSLVRLRIPCHMITPDDYDTSLKIRCERVNKICKQEPGSWLLSIHGNAGEYPNQGTGWEVYTSLGETESDKIATRLFIAARQNLPGWRMRTDYADMDPDKESKFYILVNTNCPAVLTENLFYDNEKDCRFMMSEEGKILISQLHVEGITKYML